MEAFNTQEMREHAEAAFAPFGYTRELAQQANGLALMNSHRTQVARRNLYPASEAQLSFVKSLLEKKLVNDQLAADVAFELEQPDGPQKRAVSNLIDDLLKCDDKPRAVGAPKPSEIAVPAGRYAVENPDGALRFYRVDRPTDGRWAGFVFVKVQAGDELYPVKGQGAANVLAAILEAGPREASARYGHELGHCGVCGRTLTDETSRELGIGPVCINKNGW